MTKYHKGRRFEYKIKGLLQEKGLVVLRTAGSHGFADLIVLSGRGVYFLQLSEVYSAKKEIELMHFVRDYSYLDGAVFFVYKRGKDIEASQIFVFGLRRYSLEEFISILKAG